MTNITYYDNTPFSKVFDIYQKAIYDKKINKNTSFCEWLNMEYCVVEQKKAKTVYYWECKSDDGCYRDTSISIYSTQKDCYNDMLKAASQKIIWNVEWEDVATLHCVVENEEYVSGCSGEGIMHNTEYLPNKIIDHSYSGDYIWEIKTKELEV